MNWLLIVVGVIFLVCIISGIIRGFLRIIISLAATAATIALVIFLTPYTTQALYKWTPIDEMIQEKCEEAMKPDLENINLSGVKIGGIDLGILGDIDLGDVDFESLGISDKDIKEILSSIEIPKETQTNLIKKAGLPKFLEEGLIENNNNETYKELGVTTFQEYIGAYVTKIVMTMLSFLITFILAGIIMKVIVYALAIMEELPVIHGVNRLAGGLVGIVFGVIIVWIAFLILTLMYDSEIGQMCFKWIQESWILQILYSTNPILNWLTILR